MWFCLSKFSCESPLQSWAWVEHLSLEMQTQPTLPETLALGYLLGL